MHTHQGLFPLSETPVTQVDALITADNHAERGGQKINALAGSGKMLQGYQKCYLRGLINVSELQKQRLLLVRNTKNHIKLNRNLFFFYRLSVLKPHFRCRNVIELDIKISNKGHLETNDARSFLRTNFTFKQHVPRQCLVNA